MRICKLFDRYRDGELAPEERALYESHIANCDECRDRTALLNNLVRHIQAEQVHSRDLAVHIAHRAFEKEHSWDEEVISWLRPGPALAALTLMIALVSSLWIVSNNRQAIAYSEYEKLMEQADAAALNSRLTVNSDRDLVVWLQQEGDLSD